MAQGVLLQTLEAHAKGGNQHVGEDMPRLSPTIGKEAAYRNCSVLVREVCVEGLTNR